MFWLLLFIGIIVLGSFNKPNPQPQGTRIYKRRSYSKPTKQIPDPFWYSLNKSVVVAGVTLPEGLIYVGSGLASVDSEYTTEPALIDPSLAVAADPEENFVSIGYWPAYAALTNGQRRTYLNWLANGRSDRNIEIGYVFLYFYGLERRALVDLNAMPLTHPDIIAINIEVTRLRTIYSANHSFNFYSSKFLDVLTIRKTSVKFYELEPSYSKSGFDFPIANRMALGQLCADQKPLPDKWALAWVLTSPTYFPRTPAHRCADEFRNLFYIRYQQIYGEGLVLTAPKRKLKVDYRSATNSFRNLKIDIPELPDVASSLTLLKKLTKIADACCAELDPYSRRMGRKSGTSSIGSKALLPIELHNKENIGPVYAVREKVINKMAGHSSFRISSNELLSICFESQLISSDSEITKAEQKFISELFEKWDLLIEPDPRFRGASLNKCASCIIFLNQEERLSVPSKGYVMSLFLARLAAMVATSTQKPDKGQGKMIINFLQKLNPLTKAERFRMGFHLDFLLGDKVTISGFSDVIDRLTEDQKTSIKGFLIAVAGFDGKIEPSEIKNLGRIYRLLGFSDTNLFSELNELSASPAVNDDPLVTIPAENTVTGTSFSIPKVKTKSSDAIILNSRLIEEKLADSKKAVSLLQAVFSESSKEEEAPPNDIDDVQKLDLKHDKFLKEILKRASWERKDVEELAATIGVLVDGALEKINDYSFDQFGCPVWEGHDPIEINPEFPKENAA